MNGESGETLEEGMAALEDGQPAETSAPMGAEEICVPTAALAMPDDAEQMTEPEAGDVVTMQVEARVSRVEGDKTYVVPESVNGQDVSKSGERGAGSGELTPEQADQAEYSRMEDEARSTGMIS